MTRLKHIAKIQTGVYLRPSPVADTLYLQVGSFDTNGNISTKCEPSIALDSEYRNYLLQENDLLFAAKGTNNFCTIFHSQKYNAVASISFLVIKLTAKDRLLHKYLCWYLNLQTTLQYLSLQAKGTAIPSISKATIEELDIPIPSIDKQIKIVEIAELQKIEEKLYKEIIRKREQLTEYKLKSSINNGN